MRLKSGSGVAAKLLNLLLVVATSFLLVLMTVRAGCGSLGGGYCSLCEDGFNDWLPGKREPKVKLSRDRRGLTMLVLLEVRGEVDSYSL